MWKGYDEALKLYLNIAISCWIELGYKNTMQYERINLEQLQLPKWLGNSRFHHSHQSNLLRKNYKHYSQFNWNVANNLPYVWPIKEE